MRDEKPQPPDQFQHWVNVNIIYDSQEQMTLINDEGKDWMQQAIEIAGTVTLDQLQPEMNFNMRDETLLRWLQERSLREAQLIQGVTDKDVLMTLWDVVMEGKFSIDKASKALQEAYSFSPARSTVIARTEIISAGRSGQYHGDMQSGIVIGKKWMAANQERTRPGHRSADGQVVSFDKPFWVKNKNGVKEPLMFPGDTSLGATASNVIQCRCWYFRILEGEEMK